MITIVSWAGYETMTTPASTLHVHLPTYLLLLLETWLNINFRSGPQNRPELPVRRSGPVRKIDTPSQSNKYTKFSTLITNSAFVIAVMTFFYF